MYILGKRSRSNLHRVHPDLILVTGRAIVISEVDFGVIDGARTLAEQQRMIDTGASSLKKPESSRHVVSAESGYCHAVDVMAYLDGKGRWDWPLYDKIAVAFKQASKELKIPIEWGGDWKSFKDGPHYQLPRKLYR